MKWDSRERKYWVVGDRGVFRLSKLNCVRFLEALVLCDGQVHRTFSLDVYDGESRYGQKSHEWAVMFLISLPIGSEGIFSAVVGDGVLEEPKEVHLNSMDRRGAAGDGDAPRSVEGLTGRAVGGRADPCATAAT